MPHSLRAKLSGLRYKGILEDKDYKRLCHALDLEKAEQELKTGQWQELKETITEMRDNDGKCTQQEVCKFLVNYMEVLEKQMQEPKTGRWRRISIDKYTTHAQYWYECDKCGEHNLGNTDFCPNCGAEMENE